MCHQFILSYILMYLLRVFKDEVVGGESSNGETVVKHGYQWKQAEIFENQHQLLADNLSFPGTLESAGA